MDDANSKTKQALRHPLAWWRGADLPEEKIRPWEGGIQLFAEGLKGFMKGFTDMRDMYYIGDYEGKILPNWKSVHDVTRVTLDGLSNPVIGSMMDRGRYGVRAHRWIMRFNATLSPLLIMLQCFQFGGMTPFQRIIEWTLVSVLANLISTTNAVSETKLWAGITPLTEQRGIIQTCKTVGNQLASAASGIPMIFIGLMEQLGLSYYQIMVYGALIFAPLTIFCRWLPTYAKQRVDFTVRVKGEDQAEEPSQHAPTFKESFAVVKHNRWFMMQTAVNLMRMFFPKTDYKYLYRFLLEDRSKTKILDKLIINGKPAGGEILYVLKNVTFGLVGVLFQPFAVKVIAKFKDKVNFVRAHTVVSLVTTAAMFLVRYETWPRLLFMFTAEMVRELFDRWSPIAQELIRYEMFDYVEWKTGQRSEGMTTAVDAMINKLIRDNVGNVVGNAVTQWTGFKGYVVPVEEQPERFKSAIWPLLFVGKFVGELFALGAYLWFKYPRDPGEVEADLIERRALAQQRMEEAAV
ncbi:MAG: MFS transporter [Firmicutes bacterium]|nr:MFS transporter [Bacillota bacterium]